MFTARIDAGALPPSAALAARVVRENKPWTPPPRPATPITPRRRISLALHMFGQGGTDRVCAYLANGFAAAGHDVEIVAFCNAGEAEQALLPLIDPAVKLVFLGPRTGSRPRDLGMRLPAFVRHLRQRAPDCVLSTGNNMNWITALGVRLAAVAGCRLVMKTTNPIVRPHDPAIKRRLRAAGYARAFRAADLVLTLSDEETAQLRSAFPASATRFRTVANPYVTPAMLGQRRFPAAAPGGERLILGVGRFSKQKRMDLLLHAFARLQTSGVRLALLGDGPERARLQALAMSLGIARNVAFPGFVTNVGDWFGVADLFVLPSLYEGLPAVVLEAMAADCPVVATDCFAAAKALVGETPGCALLTDADPGTLADLIDRQLAATRPSGLRFIASRYAVDRAVAQHLAAIDTLFPPSSSIVAAASGSA